MRTAEKTEGLTTVHDRAGEFDLLTKELHYVETRYFRLTEPIWDRAAEAIPGSGEDGKAVTRIAGSFSVGDRMYGGSEPPQLPAAPAPEAEPETEPPDELEDNPYYVKVELGDVRGVYTPKDE